MDKMTIIWLAVAIIMAVAEASTVQLVSLWFALGGVCACICSMFTDSIPIQIAVFIVVSGIALLATRPLAKRIKSKVAQPTNADRYIGRTGVVIKAINNELAEGLVKVDNEKWTARSENSDPIPEGENVTVVAIQGVKLIVKPTNK